MPGTKIKCFVLFLALVFALISVSAATENNNQIVIKNNAVARMETRSSRHTLFEEASNIVKPLANTEDYTQKISNEVLEVWFREKTDSIIIADKRSGYIWNCFNKEESENLNKRWNSFANSICSIEYYDKNNKIKQTQLCNEKATYKWNSTGLSCTFNAGSIGIKFVFEMTLKNDNITFTVKDESIEESGKNKLKSIYFMPFLGSTYQDEIPGYFFVPDGCGALIRFAKSYSYISGFEKKVYGSDIGTDTVSEQRELQATRTNDYMIEQPQISLPIFGVVHGNEQNAIMSVAHSGDEYASIIANPAGVTLDYNWAAMRFDYRQTYMRSFDNSGNGVIAVQDKKNAVNLKQSFYFLTGESADYSGMAVYYRSLLETEGRLHSNKGGDTIPLMTQYIGSEVKKGFLKNRQVVLSDINGVINTVENINTELGIKNQTVVFEGWEKGARSGADYNNLNIDKKLGTKENLNRLRDMVDGIGGDFYLSVASVTANKDQISISREAAVSMSKMSCKYEDPNTAQMYYENYIIKPNLVCDKLKRLFNKYSDYSFALTDIGYRLYSDFTRNNESVRTETMENFKETVSGAKNVAVNNANAYWFGTISKCLNTPVGTSQLLFETDTVPFLQIVIRGSIECYAPFANQGFYSNNSILKMIEYGIYPSFVLICADNERLTDTPLENYFSVNYDDWKDVIKSVYDKVNQALSSVVGEKIIEHKQVDIGLARVTYNNGIKVYVNYSDKECVVDGITVQPQSFYVKK